MEHWDWTSHFRISEVAAAVYSLSLSLSLSFLLPHTLYYVSHGKYFSSLVSYPRGIMLYNDIMSSLTALSGGSSSNRGRSRAKRMSWAELSELLDSETLAAAAAIILCPFYNNISLTLSPFLTQVKNLFSRITSISKGKRQPLFLAAGWNMYIVDIGTRSCRISLLFIHSLFSSLPFLLLLEIN